MDTHVHAPKGARGAKTAAALLSLAAAIEAAAGCADAFDIHPYDTRIDGKTGINGKNIRRIEESLAGRTSFRFVMTGDTQRHYDDTADLVEALNARDDVDFVIHGGDFSDFGVTKEFVWMRDILEDLKVPYVGLIGNHDLLGNGEKAFATIFGRQNFTFTAGDVLFVALSTNCYEYDYSHPIPDFGFMEGVLERDDLPARTIVVMHAAPFSEEFNNNVAKPFQSYVASFPGLMFCLHAHNHELQEDDLFGDGVTYYGSDSVDHRNYLLFTVTPEGYAREVVEF